MASSSRCNACGLSVKHCLCASIPRVETRTRFLIVRHVVEGYRRTNTARLAALAMRSVEIREHGGEASGRAGELNDGRTWLLYPGGDEAPAGPLPERLLVLDGSWRQARRMFLRLPGLRGMPRFSVAAPAGPEAPRLRRAPATGGMATLEAIAWAVEKLEGAETARPLHALYAEFVRRSLIEARAVGKRVSG